MNSAYHRHDISDEVWMLLEPYLAGQNSKHESCNTTPQEPKIQRDYDPELYRLRHIVENTFLHLKQWRSIATRSAKTSTSFLLQPFKSDLSLSGLKSRDDTTQEKRISIINSSKKPN